MYKIKEKGFTLIELLVVIAIIGILAGTLFVAINPKEQSDKANDAKRLVFINQLQKALDLYFLDHNSYPQYPNGYGVNTWSNPGRKTIDFQDDLKPYMTFDLNKMFGHDEFWYRSPSDNNYQTYSLAINLKSDSNHDKEVNDGGHWTIFYEVGEDPKYCKNKYSGNNAQSVRFPGDDSRCKGGN